MGPGRVDEEESEESASGLFIWAVYFWAVGGVLLLLGQAIVRLGMVAFDAMVNYPLTATQSAVTVSWILASAFLEGYRGFQLRFVPRVLARAHFLGKNPDPVASFLAPLFAMGFFRATVRAKTAAWGVSILVVIAILVVRRFPQPWRGIVDVGVVVGLSWGVIALVIGVARRLSGRAPTSDPELAEAPARPAPSGV